MANDDLEIARKILRGAWAPQRQRRKAHAGSVAPASFREIDGLELARQYATHRKIEKASGLQAPPPTHRFGEAGSESGLGGMMRNWARELRSRFASD